MNGRKQEGQALLNATELSRQMGTATTINRLRKINPELLKPKLTFETLLEPVKTAPPFKKVIPAINMGLADMTGPFIIRADMRANLSNPTKSPQQP